MVFAKIYHPEFEEVSQLSKTDRGPSGFGSTGLRENNK